MGTDEAYRIALEIERLVKEQGKVIKDMQELIEQMGRRMC